MAGGWHGGAAYLSRKGHASGHETPSLCVSGSHHGELAIRHEIAEIIDLLLERCLRVKVGLLVWVGMLSGRVGELIRHDELCDGDYPFSSLGNSLLRSGLLCSYCCWYSDG